eukprot:CAMPEP_0182904194 /NCGR_PEP_ID=MMETSP0034_2-20130328/31919_1 /TAXON_ID=156128 /ORGANISM="Nephroselmis pyriformis, Strain CCMP717" /LENGTH=319 /DNA_ID=CAMNT_0025039301 /DNA_START=450 /DNA_END=1409 /DNA_ORIENTATION=-
MSFAGHVAVSNTVDDTATTVRSTASNSVAGPEQGVGENDDQETSRSFERPPDDQIIAQENAIRAAEAEKIAFVGEIEPLEALFSEYASGSEVFRRKIRSMEASYSGIRRARGDGNCFFRSFCFSYLESLLLSQDSRERKRLEGVLKEWSQKLIDGGVQQLVFEDPMEMLTDLLKDVSGSPPIEREVLAERFRDPHQSNYIIMLLRFITSCEIKRREEFFAPFIIGMSDDGACSVEEFCALSVDPMGVESDHIHITALTDALGVATKVVYLDGSALGGGADSSGVTNHVFLPEGASGDGEGEPLITLLYRPGHYDILYAK